MPIAAIAGTVRQTGLSQNSVIAAALFVGFVIYVTLRGRLAAYINLLFRSQAKAVSSSPSTPGTSTTPQTTAPTSSPSVATPKSQPSNSFGSDPITGYNSDVFNGIVNDMLNNDQSYGTPGNEQFFGGPGTEFGEGTPTSGQSYIEVYPRD